MCDNPKRGFSFICGAYSEQSLEDDPADRFGKSKYASEPVNTKLITSGTFNIKNLGSSTVDGLITNDSEFDMTDIINKVKADFETGLPRDLRIDTSDIPQAWNFIQWVNDARFSNPDAEKPWARQYDIITNFLGEVCYNPKCTNVPYAKNVPVDATIDDMQAEITYLQNGVCPKCKTNKLEQSKFGINRFNELIGIGGQRGGKTSLVNRLDEYVFHTWVRMQRPQRVFGIEESTGIEFAFTATTFGKALKNLFMPLVAKVHSSPWFKEYNGAMDHYGRKFGEELYKVMDHSIVYRHHKFHVYAESPNPQNMRGSTRGMANVDEISHLFAKTKEAVRLNPEEVHNSLRNSLLTLRMAYGKLVKQGQFNIPAPLMCNITSPRTFNDLGMQLYRRSLKPQTNIYGFHRPVEEMNPNAVDDEELKQIQRDDPERYKRDFQAIPPNAANAFITNVGALQGCIIDKHSNAIKTKDIDIPGARASVKLLAATYKIITGKKIDTTTPKVLTIDAGKNKNSFAIVIAHNETILEDGFERDLKIIDAVAEVIPRDDMTLSHAAIMEDLVFPLIEEFNVKVMLADRWNSLQMLQQVEAEFDIIAEQYSLKYADFIEFKRDMFEGSLGFPMAEGVKIKDLFEFSSENYPMCFHGKPIAHFFFQCLTVEDIMGKTVDKGTGFTDDIFRAAVLAHYALNNDELAEILENAKQTLSKANPFVGAIGSLSGGTTLLGGGTVQGNPIQGGLMQGKNGAVAAIASNVPFGGNR